MAWDWGSARQNAASGAGVGTAIMPGIGTAIGGAAGGLLGGLTGGKGKAKAPDFSQAAHPNSNTPWANQSWTKDANGRDVSTMSLQGDAAPALQNIQANMLRASQYDPTKARDEAIQSNYGQATSRLDPQWQQREQAFASTAANSGIDPGTQAYNAQAGNESRAKNDAYNSAMANAVQMGNQTQATQMQQMNQPFNQYSSLIGSSMAQPNMGGGLQGSALQYGANQDQAAQTQGQKQGMMSGAGSLLGGKGKAGAPDYGMNDGSN
jgi:hypothetical protein